MVPAATGPGPDRPATGRARVVTRAPGDFPPPYPVPAPPLPAAEGGLYGNEPEQRRRVSRHRAIRKRKHMPLWQELPLLLLVAFGLAVLIRTFLLQAFYIPSGSMEHTLDIGDKVVVNKIIYDVRDPQRGEVIVFRGTDKWAPEHQEPSDSGFFGSVGAFFGDLIGLSPPGEKDFIKRVVGLPGDTVSCCDPKGRVFVNGVAIDEPYIYDNSPLDAPPSGEECRGRSFDPVVVPAGQVFVMGDHRGVSQDSRCQGPVPVDNIIGRAFLVVWPASRLNTLPAAETFDKVPDATAMPPATGPPGPLLPAAGMVVIAHWWFRSRRAARSASLNTRAHRRLSA